MLNTLAKPATQAAGVLGGEFLGGFIEENVPVPSPAFVTPAIIIAATHFLKPRGGAIRNLCNGAQVGAFVHLAAAFFQGRADVDLGTY